MQIIGPFSQIQAFEFVARQLLSSFQPFFLLLWDLKPSKGSLLLSYSLYFKIWDLGGEHQLNKLVI